MAVLLLASHLKSMDITEHIGKILLPQNNLALQRKHHPCSWVLVACMYICYVNIERGKKGIKPQQPSHCTHPPTELYVDIF